MGGRLVLNGTTEIRGSVGEISATHVSLATTIWLQTMVPLTAGDTVELQGYFETPRRHIYAPELAGSCLQAVEHAKVPARTVLHGQTRDDDIPTFHVKHYAAIAAVLPPALRNVGSCRGGHERFLAVAHGKSVEMTAIFCG
ncbi:hypothetical protein V8324_16415 [Roseovarius sp. D22-M7]